RPGPRSLGNCFASRVAEIFKHSKAVSQGSQRLCLVPHTSRFLGRHSWAFEPAVKAMRSSPFPRTPFRKRGTSSPTDPNLCVTRRLFCGLTAPSASHVEH